MLVRAVLATGFLGLPVISALDVFYWHAWPLPAPRLSDSKLILFALGWGLKGLALRQNAFASATVRLHRAHAVADTGVYAVIRHPYYTTDLLIHIGLGLWLQSYVAVLGAAIPISLMMIRLHFEERFRQHQLSAYGAYVMRVKCRLITGVW